MSWVVKTRSDGEYMTTASAWLAWSKSLADAHRFASEADARRAADEVHDEYKPVVVRLVPKRKPEPMPTVTPQALMESAAHAERKAVLVWMQENNVAERVVAAIRAGEHRR